MEIKVLNKTYKIEFTNKISENHKNSVVGLCTPNEGKIIIKKASKEKEEKQYFMN